MLIGSVAIGLASCGGFCAGSEDVVNHQVSRLSLVFAVDIPNTYLLLAHQRPILRLLSCYAGPSLC